MAVASQAVSAALAAAKPEAISVGIDPLSLGDDDDDLYPLGKPTKAPAPVAEVKQVEVEEAQPAAAPETIEEIINDPVSLHEDPLAAASAVSNKF